MDLVVDHSARKHGVTEAQIREAVANPYRVETVDTRDGDQLTMVYGFDRDGNAIEVGILDPDPDENDDRQHVIHAMPARP